MLSTLKIQFEQVSYEARHRPRTLSEWMRWLPVSLIGPIQEFNGWLQSGLYQVWVAEIGSQVAIGDLLTGKITPDRGNILVNDKPPEADFFHRVHQIHLYGERGKERVLVPSLSSLVKGLISPEVRNLLSKLLSTVPDCRAYQLRSLHLFALRFAQHLLSIRVCQPQVFLGHLTIGMDWDSQQQAILFLKELARNGHIVVEFTDNLSDAANADGTLVMSNGQLIMRVDRPLVTEEMQRLHKENSSLLLTMTIGQWKEKYGKTHC